MQSIRDLARSAATGLLRSLAADERVLAAWPYACGTATASRAQAVRYEAGVLYIEIAGREWHQLSGLKPAYLSKLRQLTGVAVNDISFALEDRR